MTSIKSLPVFILATLLLIGIASAVPALAPAYDISSNNATFNVTLITGNVAYIIYGQNPGGECWNSANYTPFAGQANITIWGAPIMGSTRYFVKACDSTGCSNEIRFTTAQITPMPVTTFGQIYRNITGSHFNSLTIWREVINGYTNVVPETIFFGIILGVIVIGMWARNKSTRLVGILMMIISPIIMYTASPGLNLGIPLAEQALGQALLAAGFAGVLLSFIKK
jgi:hypothetical protein